MRFKDMPILPSTAEGTCPICESEVAKRGLHICDIKVIDRNHFPASKEDEILGILGEIKELLEKIYMDI